MNSSLRSLSLWMAVVFIGVLLLSPFADAQRKKNRSGLVPPPPPPYESARLAAWAEVGPAKLANCLMLASKGHLAKAIESLDALIAESDQDLKERLLRERERMVGLQDFRSAWLKEQHVGNKNIRIPVEGKMAAFKIASIDNEKDEVVFTKKRKNVDRMAISDLTPFLLIQNLSRKFRDIEPEYLRAYVPGLAEQDWDPEKVGTIDAVWLEEMQQYPWILRLGSLGSEIVSLSEAGYPEGHAELMGLIERLGAVAKTATGIPVLKGMGPDIKSYAADLASRAFAKAPIGELLKGKATDLGEGRWKFVYEFENADEVTDFYNQPDLFEYCLPEATKKATADSSGWLHDKDAIAWAGRTGIVHHIPFTGAMTARYDWQVSRIGETFDIQGGNLIFGMAAQHKALSFVGHAFIHSVWCYQKGQLVNNSNGPIPMYEKRTYKCVLERNAEGMVTGSVDGKETGKASVPEVTYGPFFMTTNLNIRGRLERLELEGTVDTEGVDFFRKIRAYEHLKSFNLEGSEPQKPTE